MRPDRDITNLDDIRRMVDSFYDKVKRDELLGPVFHGAIAGRWPKHLEKMYRFWQTVLLDAHTYHGSPFMPHARLPVEARHFERWLSLFRETIDEHFAGPAADRAKRQAERMAEMFRSKIEYHRTHNLKPLL